MRFGYGLSFPRLHFVDMLLLFDLRVGVGVRFAYTLSCSDQITFCESIPDML